MRRIYRFGQKQTVNSYIVLGSTELHILENINQKKMMQETLKNQMDISVKEIQLLNFQGKEVLEVEENKQIELPQFI